MTTNWWDEESASEAPEGGAQHGSGSSVYEQRYAEGRGETWIPVAEIHPDGSTTSHEGWARRVRGWQPLDDLIADRTNDPLYWLTRPPRPL